MEIGMRKSACGIKTRRSLCAITFRNPQTAIRNRAALTLVELLVVIVILTTLVGGVIPVLSPNNDTRKIRAAARGLQGYISLVQAKAARTGRPQGIGFVESSAESAVALEVFGLEVPPPFAGFSTTSRVRVQRAVDVVSNPTTDDISYGIKTAVNPRGNSGTQFSPQYFGYELFSVRFELATPPVPPAVYVADQLPPRTFSVGDMISVDGNQFLIVDDGRQFNGMPSGGSVSFVDPALNPDPDFENSLICVWINHNGQVIPQGLKRFAIQRQPTNSSQSPYQLPSGIVIDMQGSVAKGSAGIASAFPRFPTTESLYTNRTGYTGPPPAPTDNIGIMFSPTGAVDSLFINGIEATNSTRIVLLLGLIENAIAPQTITIGDTSTYPWAMQAGEEIKDVQERVNWLSLDSRLVSIVPTNGRVVVSETAYVDLNLTTDSDGDSNVIGIDPDDQIEAAHEFANEMSTLGGN